MIQNLVDCDRELTRLTAGTVGADEMLQVSRRIMALADGSRWSQAAAHHGKALYSQGRIVDALAIFEEAWQRADQLNDPIAGALAARLGGACCATLYDYPQAEKWYTRELYRPRSRLVVNLRYALSDLLAAARVSTGDIAGARESLAEFEGAESRHFLIAYLVGDWERGVLLLRQELDAARAAGQILGVASSGSLLGRFARIGNQHDEAEAYLSEALTASLDNPDLNRELFSRIELALVDADLGQVAEAKEQLKRCQQIIDGGENWRGHNGAFAYTSALVSAAEHLRKTKSAQELWRISPHRGGTPRLPEEIAEGFGVAIEIFRRYHAPWEEAAVLLFWSRVLFAASRHRLAAEKFNNAFEILDRIDTPQFCERLQAEVFRFLTVGNRVAETITVDGGGSNVFRKEGDYWTISFEGSVFRLRDTMGMHYISQLIANPGTDFPAQDLAAAAHKPKFKPGSRKTSGPSMPNGRTNAEYLGDNAAKERARLMVTKRIKDSITKIRLTNPELARHLSTCIRTGYACAYLPDDDHPNGWATESAVHPTTRI